MAFSFTYKASDGQAQSGVATVTITVTPVNDAPVAANDDSYTTAEDTQLTVSAPGVLANDSDVDGDALSAVLVSNPTHGTLTLNGDGSFSYMPALNYNGVDSFTYKASDGQAQSDVATVTITVTPVNDAPVAANDDSYTTAEDTQLTVSAPGVLANDSDVDGDALSAVLVSNPTHGTLTLNGDGSFSYMPALNYNGVDSFTYKASDGQAQSDVATVTITVTPVNDAPVAANDDSYTTAEDTQLTVSAPGVLANDSDVDGDALSAVLVSNPTHGTLTLNGDGSFSYMPALNYNGVDSFTYKASDGQAQSDVATVTITVTPVNDAPVAANDDSYTTPEDTQLTVSAPGVLANDSDVDGDALSAVLVSNPTHGTLTLNGDGSFSYMPALNYNGVDSFTYKASDGQAQSDVATVTITVTPVNDAPVAANDDSYTTPEDTQLTVSAPGVLANDSDVDGDALSAVLVSNPTHGTLTLNGDGSFSYMPALNYNGVDSFTYKASDGQAQSDVATVTITVTPVNDAPVAANDDSYTTPEDTQLTVSAPGVLANDSDVDGDALSAVLVSNPTHGTLTLNGDGSFSYMPALNYNGVDSFTYKASDGQAQSDVATVTITVTPVNDAPVAANDDSYTTAEDTQLTVSASGVLANDSDVDGDALSAVLVSNPTHGTLTLNGDGSFTYMPALNFNGIDSFTYKASDGQAQSGVATVTITVTSLNNAPVAANDDSYTTPEDTQLTVSAPGVLANDSDVDGDALSAVLVSGPSHGTLTLNGDGSLVYVPALNFNGVDSFTYKASDGQAQSDVATVTITVTPVNNAPVAVNDSYTTPEDTQLTVSAPGVLANDSDVDGDALSAVLVSSPSHGTLTLNGDGSLVYMPALNFNGIDSFTYKASDGQAQSGVATVTITVTPVNDAPVAANDDSYTTPEDTQLTVSAPGVLANDSDVDADTLSAVLVSNPTHGTLTLNSDGSLVYVPALNFNGIDSFTYKASDGQVQSGVATVTITVTPVNDAPVAANDDSYTTPEDTQLTVSAPGVLANDSDVDGDALSAVLVSGPSHGTLTLNGDGSLVCMPALNFNGIDSFTYKASDGQTQSGVATVTITVTPVNDAPVAANDDSYTTPEDTQLTVSAPGVLANDSDVDGDALSAVLVSGPSHGTLTLNSDGSFSYMPALNFNGIDSFTYKASDGQVQSGVATVTITVTPVNDAPVAANNDNYTTPEDTQLTVSAPGVLANDSDVDADTLSAVL